MGLIFSSLFLSSFLLLAACTPQSDSVEASTPPPEGRKLGEGEAAKGSINGQSWTFRSGRAYSFHTHQSDYMVIQLWSQYFADPCKEKTGSTLQVRLTTPLSSTVTSWNISPEDPLNANISIFFTDLDFVLQPRDNMRADRGEIAFGIVSPQEVYGYFAGSFRNPKVGGTSVTGDFVVPFCP